jgi:hypothetical protein
VDGLLFVSEFGISRKDEPEPSITPVTGLAMTRLPDQTGWKASAAGPNRDDQE